MLQCGVEDVFCLFFVVFVCFLLFLFVFCCFCLLGFLCLVVFCDFLCFVVLGELFYFPLIFGGRGGDVFLVWGLSGVFGLCMAKARNSLWKKGTIFPKQTNCGPG